MQNTIRVATYNVSLFGKEPGETTERLKAKKDQQIADLLAVLTHANPDIVLINELDFDETESAANAFAQRLSDALPEHSAFGARAFTSNTGVQSGYDLTGSGSIDSPENAQGYGAFPGQYGFALLSRFPVTDVRSFGRFLWRDMPGARLPDAHPGSGQGDYFSPEAQAVLRLSSKNHVDAVVEVPGLGALHLLLSHPTPPVFDGPERRNARRNADEIRLWADYLDGADYLVDDDGRTGGLPPDAAFVILGDLNADPVRGDSLDGAVQQILHHVRVQDPRPMGAGGQNTAAFHGGMRVDYVLPANTLSVVDSRVCWFARRDPLAVLNRASDHYLVWIDLKVAA